MVVDPYTIEEWKTAMLTILDTPQLPDNFMLLVDRRRSQLPSQTFIEQMVEFFRAHEPRLSKARAAVVVADPTGFGMARIAEALTELRVGTFNLRPFYDVDDAERWLLTGLD